MTPIVCNAMLAATCAFVAVAPVMAQTFPLSVQGELTGVPDGQQSMTLKIWDAATGGNEVASVPLTTQVVSGVFSATVHTPNSAFTGADRWWSVFVPQGETNRQRIATVPYAGATGTIFSDATTLGPLTVSGALRVQSTADGQPLLHFDMERLWLFEQQGSGQATRLVLRDDSGGKAFEIQAQDGNPLARFDTFEASVSIDGLLRLRSGASGEPLLRFDMDRSWLFEQRETGPSTKLVLRDDSGGKTFEVQAQSGDALATFDTSTMAIGIRTSSPQAALDVRGRIQSQVLTITGGSDLAEPFSASADSEIKAKPGMVMSIDQEHPGALRIASTEYDPRVAGVFSGANGLPTGMIMGKEGCDLTAPGLDKVPLAMTGRVWVYADESNGAITPGDRLTTSGSKPGHAMKATDRNRWDGTVIGKAMTGMDPESGMVLVLVNLQ